jgi:branched-chain amino acid aminotransferase
MAVFLHLSVHGTQLDKVMTDHMLYIDFSPESGWSPPEIKPYGPLNLDPACSCFHYCPNVFEGLKVVPHPHITV